MDDVDEFDCRMFDEQVKISIASIGEVNRLRREVRRLTKELAEQGPSLWAQQERIVMLEGMLPAAEIGKSPVSAPGAVEGGKT